MSFSSRPAQEDAFLKLGQLCMLRGQGNYTEDEVARKLGFGSADAMRIQLKNWGLPDWLTDDRMPAAGTESAGGPKDVSKKRKARSSLGEGEDLPDVDRAVEIFRKDIKHLEWLLMPLSGHFTEQLHGERFVSYSRVEDDSEHFHRSMFSDQQWKELCEKWGVDPSVEEFYLPLAPHVSPLGAGDTPWRGLTIFIGLHALLHPSVDRLIDALHPDPSSVDRKKLYDQKGKDAATQDGYVTTLKSTAAKIAKIMRGGKADKRGASYGKVPHHELELAWRWILPLAREGYSDEEIYRKLKEEGPLGPESRYWRRYFGVDDIRRLRNLLPPPPA